MKSKEYMLQQGSSQLAELLTEVESTAIQCKLNKKEAMRLRLLAEELIGMLPSLLEYCEGKYWVSSECSELWKKCGL